MSRMPPRFTRTDTLLPHPPLFRSAPPAAAVRQGDTTTALSLLRTGNLSGVHFHENNADPLRTHRDHLLAHWTALAEATDPAEALARAARLRILTAVREGDRKSTRLNSSH